MRTKAKYIYFSNKSQYNISTQKLKHNVYGNIIHSSQKEETTHISILDKQIIKMWYIIQWNIIWSLKGNKVLIHDTTWMNLENLMLK